MDFGLNLRTEREINFFLLVKIITINKEIKKYHAIHQVSLSVAKSFLIHLVNIFSEQVKQI